MSGIIVPTFARSRFTHSPLIHGGGIRKAAAGGGGGLTSIAFQASSTSTVASVTAPAAIDLGDLLVLFDSARSAFAVPTAVTPTDFTNFINFAAISGSSFIGVRNMVSYKIADGTEDSASITGMDGGATDNKILLQFRGDAAISSVTPNVIGTPAVTDGNPGSQTITASGGTPPLILCAFYTSDGAVDPRTFSAAADGEVSASLSAYAKYKIYDSSPADHSADMDDEGANNSLASFYLEAA